MAVMKTVTLHSAFCDLGVFDHLFWDIMVNGNWQFAFFGHVWPLVLVKTAAYRLWPSAHMLVCMQAIFLTLPLFWISSFRPDRSESFLWLPHLTFILFFPLWYNILFDYHLDHLTIPLGFAFYYFCFKEKWHLAVLSCMVMSFVKEPFALMTVFCGIYLIVRWKKMTWGLAAVIFGSTYFYFSTNVIIPHFAFGAKGSMESEMFSWMGTSVNEMLLFILTHPLQILREIIFTPGKLIYLVALIGALAFIPLFRPLELIPALPILCISLLSRLENYYAIGNHYTAGLIAPMVIAFLYGVPKALVFWKKIGFIKKWFYPVLIFYMLVVHAMLSPSPISRLFWSNKVWSYGYEAYLPNNRDVMIKMALMRYIPSDSKISVSTQNSMNCSFLAHRKHYLLFPQGVLEAFSYPDLSGKLDSNEVWADYLVLDLKRPWYIGDKGCCWKTGDNFILRESEVQSLELSKNPGFLDWSACADKEFRQKFLDIVIQSKKNFKLMYENDGFMILKRKSTGR